VPPSTISDLASRIPADPEPDALLDAFLSYAADAGIELYPAQEEAILEVFAGNNVILNTPTGSGKSLVALAGHFAALARGEQSYYTAPIKALVSEKFFSLCRELGSENVGMMTGDAAVNPRAPIICCTAEVLANAALREGSRAQIDHVCVDEFHYYADRDRGWAWQVPLLELNDTAFLLMSATLGDTSRFEEDLTARNGRDTSLVRSDDRPVPLDFEYRETPLHESIGQLLEDGLAPVYIVHFTQRAATEQAQSLMSVDVLTKQEKRDLAESLSGFRFDSPFGKDLSRYVRHGIGVHHAGMLPKYRLLVEKLAQEGRLKLISGTDTLGVGINVPIRTVLFTQLCKYDGRKTRVLSVREFKQIAGRAGRKGYDDRGSVWVQAPPHVVENIRADNRVANEHKKKRKVVKKKPPERGYAHWDENTMTKLSTSEPESLSSSFGVSHMMLLNVLDRPGDGCAAVRRLLVDNHESRRDQRRHIRRAIAIYRSLTAAGIVERLPEPDVDGRMVRVNLNLQDDFSLNQPLSPYVVEAVTVLDREDPMYSLDVLTIVESVLEDPGVIMMAQLDRLKGEVITELKSQGVEYEQRMEELEKLRAPRPLEEFLESTFSIFAQANPWALGEEIRPKSVARDLYERAMTFKDFINHYGLKRSEGVVLRYLTDAYKGLVQNVPDTAKTEEVHDLTEWLGETVRQVDSSLIDEWERLQNPEIDLTEPLEPPTPPDITTNARAFAVMIRNEAFRWAQLAARRRHGELSEASNGALSAGDITEAMTDYWAEYDLIGTGPDARGPALIEIVEEGDRWPVRQTLADPDEHYEWALLGQVDLEASKTEGAAVVHLTGIEHLQ